MDRLIDVRPMPRGGWVATCDCGAYRTFEAQVEAWDWVTQHECAQVPDDRVSPGRERADR